MSFSAEAVEPIRAVHVEVSADALTVELVDGRKIAVPLSWYPRLAAASTDERNDWRLIPGGIGIHWNALDEDVSIVAMLEGKRSRESDSSFRRWQAMRGA
jgi:hypothetical protein